ncbi:hypothetical protein VKT23_008498 [Stygiomarasmius scandens]|uniref:F-box domain-containing protein n=1 Tax=Marasmiellus scandens TaxID=2682957 RepID=A0ABR1JMQ7_9AGAR
MDNIRIHDEEISKLEQNLNTLQSQRSRWHDYARQQESLLTPIRKLPVEIVSEIFKFYQLDSEYGLEILAQEEGEDSIKSPILALSHVCSHWREVSISKPPLWSAISVDFKRWENHLEDVGNSNQLRSLIELYLERSRPTPLNIKIGSFHIYLEGEAPDLIIRALLAERARWKGIALDLGHDFCDACIQLADTSDSSLHFPSLETVELDWREDSWPLADINSEPEEFLNSLLVNSPKLRRVTIPQFLDKERFSSVIESFDYRRITSIEVNGRYYRTDLDDIWSGIDQTLAEFSSLEELFISCIVPAPRLMEDDPASEITCPDVTSHSLRSLSMTLNSFRLSAAMIGALTLPLLTSLEMSVYTVQDPAPCSDAWMQSLQGMLKSCCDTLVSFKLTCYNEFSMNQLWTILSCMQKVQTLSLFADPRAMTSVLFSRLTLPSNSAVIAPSGEAQESEQPSILLPHLKTVTFGLIGLDFLMQWDTLSSFKQVPILFPDPDIILRMVLSRRPRNDAEDGLCHFGFSASTVLSKPELQNWAGNMRTKFHRLQPELRRQSSHWTCTLDLGA